ncbi:MAG: hypothetical protein QM691_11550 [Opitutaceae bacterium]
MHLNGGRHDAWHRVLGQSPLPVPQDAATRRALAEALRRAQECHDRHRLLKPHEAMAVACRDGHTTETLYSLARNAAFATGGDVDIVLQHLEHAWPDFA